MPRRILVIDDDESVRDGIEMALDGTEYLVETAVNGREGLAKALKNPPDLIFLDLRMPQLDGVSTLQGLKASGIESRVYIVTAFVPEYLDPLAEAVRNGLEFEVARKPLTSEQIRLMAEGSLDGPGVT